MTISQERVFAHATVADLAAMRRFLQETAVALGVDPESAGDMVLAMNEAASNVLRHGYRNQPGPLTLHVGREGPAFTVTLQDKAPPYDPTGRPPPDTSLALTQRPLGGMGVHLIREFADAVHYRVTADGHNELILVKFLPDQE